METDKPITVDVADAIGVDNVFGELGNGGKYVVGVAETSENNLPDHTDEYRKFGRVAFFKYLGSTVRYMSDICVPTNREKLFNSLTMFDNYPEHLLRSNCDLCLSMTPISTSTYLLLFKQCLSLFLARWKCNLTKQENPKTSKTSFCS